MKEGTWRSKKADSVYKFINHTLELPWMARFAASSGGAGILGYEQATILCALVPQASFG